MRRCFAPAAMKPIPPPWQTSLHVRSAMAAPRMACSACPAISRRSRAERSTDRQRRRRIDLRQASRGSTAEEASHRSQCRRHAKPLRRSRAIRGSQPPQSSTCITSLRCGPISRRWWNTGFCAFLFTSYLPTVAPAGATVPFFGTNPLAFGWPGKDGYIFDAATAATARGELQIAARDGRLAPEGAGVDAAGRPTRDPNEILAGAQLPFGGHKGSAIALMIELLAGVLIGQPTSPEAGREHASAEGTSGPPRGGMLMIALDPDRFGDSAGWESHAEGFFAELRALPGVRLPGDRRKVDRARIAQDGVAVPVELWRETAAAAGLELTLP